MRKPRKRGAVAACGYFLEFGNAFRFYPAYCVPVADCKIRFPFLPERGEAFAVHAARGVIDQVRQHIIGVFNHHVAEDAAPVFLLKVFDESAAVEVWHVPGRPVARKMRCQRDR